MLLVIINALAPVAFVILLGWLAGRYGIVAATASSELAVLVLDFCLPAALFIGTASASPSQLDDWRFFAAIAIDLLAIYLAGLVIGLLVFRHRVDAASLQALNGSFPNMAFMGIPVLTAVISPSAVLPVVVGNLVSSLVLLPVTLALLEAVGTPTTARRSHNGSRAAAPERVLGRRRAERSLSPRRLSRSGCPAASTRRRSSTAARNSR
jgi:malonate transporter and related proteins